jgi:hypothetical protein
MIAENPAGAALAQRRRSVAARYRRLFFLFLLALILIARTNGKYGLLKMEVLAVHSLNASVVWQAVGTVQNVIALSPTLALDRAVLGR